MNATEFDASLNAMEKAALVAVESIGMLFELADSAAVKRGKDAATFTAKLSQSAGNLAAGLPARLNRLSGLLDDSAVFNALIAANDTKPVAVAGTAHYSYAEAVLNVGKILHLMISVMGGDLNDFANGNSVGFTDIQSAPVRDNWPRVAKSIREMPRIDFNRLMVEIGCETRRAAEYGSGITTSTSDSLTSIQKNGFPSRTQAEVDASKPKPAANNGVADHIVTLEVIAKAASRSPRTMEKYVKHFPAQYSLGSGTKPATWRWSGVRPVLCDKFPRDQIPQSPPSV